MSLGIDIEETCLWLKCGKHLEARERAQGQVKNENLGKEDMTISTEDYKKAMKICIFKG